MKYIIQPGIEIGNPDNRKINVLTIDEINDYRERGFNHKEKEYVLSLGRIEYEVICVEIWQKGDKEHSLIIPTFLIPHRTYPAYVYAFAINLYSSNPQLGQRKVAEETQEKYDLETFAHTTVGRAMKTLAETLTETAAGNSETKESVEAREQNEAKFSTIKKERFPSVKDTNTRREIVKSFFYEKLKSHCQQWFNEACDIISIYWYTHFHRLFMNTAPGFRRRLSFVIQNT